MTRDRDQRARLRERLAQPGVLVIPGAHDAAVARVVQAAGFEAVYVSGAATANAVFGLPDIELVDRTEMAAHAGRIAAAVDIPVISDADTGYGNPLAVVRTVDVFERAGVAGIHLEDQVSPKRCGHLDGKDVVPVEDMEAKIRAAVEARRDPDFLIIARTDARAVHGFDDAVQRALRYRAAGADAIFPEALQSEEEFAAFARRVPGPLVANMTEFGKTPYLSAADFERLGYKVVLFPVTSLRVALKAVEEAMRRLRAEGTQRGFLDRMQTRAELYELVDYPGWKKREARYASV
ncbi:MAG: methylisocitrate lyase [Clostridia bacterium]|nr:methylisocitrate lyase [Clostridia bacterium]